MGIFFSCNGLAGAFSNANGLLFFKKFKLLLWVVGRCKGVFFGPDEELR